MEQRGKEWREEGREAVVVLILIVGLVREVSYESCILIMTIIIIIDKGYTP